MPRFQIGRVHSCICTAILSPNQKHVYLSILSPSFYVLALTFSQNLSTLPDTCALQFLFPEPQWIDYALAVTML
jgi:hypothetical protein